jgi:Ca2+-binding RTX toxin-like protein
VFRGGPGDDWFETNRGDDRFYGGPGRDSFSLGYQEHLGSAVMFGQEGDDWLYFETLEGADSCMLPGITIRLFGHEGNDHFVVGPLIDIRSCAEIIIKGGVGEGDSFRSGSTSDPMLIDLERGIAKVRHWTWPERFLLASIENATGGDGDDMIIGNGDANILRSERGEDELRGRGGDDTLDGDDGPDQLFGGNGDDTLDGGRGNDHLNGGDGNDSLDGGPHNDECTRGEIHESCEVVL